MSGKSGKSTGTDDGTLMTDEFNFAILIPVGQIHELCYALVKTENDYEISNQYSDLRNNNKR